ncbi:putative Nascent polypeptide-associated complex subunit beta [Blattamonas nauphoetae]|uniref:Nascent polypeptide-associated complex subunit beta n=1 Tax=Blattamonas nauphoetae TaxID=2049346 RepID=A0ABQ9Y9J9_9EUKA|nr:putative Nascent polypeptide-associated complex subunit beta [Blattamonas nauphoetae]
MGKGKGQKAQPKVDIEKLRSMANQVRTGGKGSVRRKVKVVSRPSGGDSQKLQSFIQQNNCHPIPGIDGVEMVKNDGTVMDFKNPKVTLNMQSNVTVVEGKFETKSLADMLKGIDQLKLLQEQLQKADKSGAIPTNVTSNFDAEASQ